ncbi:hypothetical protein [Galbibacter mesophilus]|uniref:hypothetical protein n=1 Tax=Galbibacter mesophilus TaxID=379069 RepID=UPI00191F7A4D|nr:hypothetical protein [Galbibacter mesophilus]MCM5663215.1 hypothetical protein [Galbibacter mesophilus]
MKKQFYTISISLFLLGNIFQACESIEILPPPDQGEVEKTGSGDSDVRGILFLKNDTTTVFIDPASTETHVVSNITLDFFINDEFGKPTNPSDANAIELEKLPIPIANNLVPIQPNRSSGVGVNQMETAAFSGAFSADGANLGATGWNTDSEWFQLNTQNKEYPMNNIVEVTGRITTNTAWTKDTQYLLKGQVFVTAGVTLTIEAGTVIYGEEAVGVQSGVLVFNRGSLVDAVGTPEEPIVFTTNAPAGTRTRGKWGGVVFCGNGPSNKGVDIAIEGIQGENEEDGLYGGNDPSYNAGDLAYWRVEYAGIAVSAGNELNSITFGGIGYDTNAHHLLINYAGDDAIEWFGGNINLKYIAVYNCLDDDLDMDQGFSGDIQYVYLVRNPYSADESGSACMEVSSSKSVGTMPRTMANVANVTLVGPVYQLEGTGLLADPKYQGGLSSKDDANVVVTNSFFIGCPTGAQNP